VVTYSNNLLTATNSIQQVIISGLPVGAVTAYVDNVYFSSTTVGTTEFDSNNFSFYPNPTASQLNFHTTSQVESVKVYNMLGQQVMAETPNTVSPSLKVEALQAGTYIMNVTINGLSENFRFIKE
ncbi:MAG: T9SS type A sorting domain-containing protein, partial [Psychroflexus sp.]|nr:T9SS type A sorting domain-containing protein [Psychroflexus sp.]